MKSTKAKDLFCSSSYKVGRVRRWRFCSLVMILFWLNPLLVFSAAETDNAAQPTTLPLEAASDSAIEKRLRAVIDNIDDFQNVKIDVNDGVVRLSGTTLRKEATEKVVQMVSRFEGVIYVDNQIQVETDVETRVKPALTRVNQYLSTAVQKLPLIGVALVVIIVFWLMSRFVTHWDLPYQRLGLNRLLRNLVRQFLRKGILLLGVLLAFDILDLTALVGAVLGTVGVVGLAIGFAFKDIVENYLAGLLLSIRRPFDLNDLVLIESHEGRVVRLTPSELILMTLEGNHVRIPNATVFKSFIYNYSINPRRRFDFEVGVGVNEDLVGVRECGCGVMRKMAGVMAEPAPFMIVEKLGDFNVLVRFFGWIDQRKADFAKVRGEAIRRVKLALDDAGISMPEPIQTIRLEQDRSTRPETTSTPGLSAQGPEERETKTVDVSPDTQLEDQIKEDLSATHEPNLLTET
jgi:small conductance mechanosensitive channel